jgi:hypothetical protein
MDFDNLSLYDTDYNLIAQLEWDYALDGTEVYLTDENGITTTYTIVSDEDAADIFTYLFDLLNNEEEETEVEEGYIDPNEVFYEEDLYGDEEDLDEEVLTEETAAAEN